METSSMLFMWRARRKPMGDSGSPSSGKCRVGVGESKAYYPWGQMPQAITSVSCDWR